MSDWYEELSATRAMVWTCLEEGAAEAQAAARFLPLASVGEDGGEVRIVRLRAVDEREGTLTVYTDLASAKVGELQRNPRASLVIWDAARNFQVRLRVTVQVQSGADVERFWPEMTGDAQRAYGGMPPPGTAIDDPKTHSRIPQIERLAVLTMKIEEIDTVSLEEPCHHRALFRRVDAFKGQWLAP